MSKPTKNTRWKQKLHPRFPLGYTVDEEVHTRLRQVQKDLPASVGQIAEILEAIEAEPSFDAARWFATQIIFENNDKLLRSSRAIRIELLEYMERFMTPQESVYLLRRLVKDSDIRVRRKSHKVLQHLQPEEVALPKSAEEPWNYTGWTRGLRTSTLARHRTGTRQQEKNGLPPLRTAAELRKLLGIASSNQLGYLLLSTDKEQGPYTRFEIPKRNGKTREICAPRGVLKAVQRRILDKILSKVPVHNAAHGFVPGRSTVTNAACHVGRKLIIKFDLRDFFPSIHYYRVMGLFAHLGYTVQEGHFAIEDNSYTIAPLLARLTTYTPHRKAWGQGWAPQGAPTSPAISNLICRGLDARLEGLVSKMDGVYTRYADDLTFSFHQEPQEGIGRFRWWVDQICQQEGFLVRQGKFRVVRRSQRQQVTGIVVNDTLRIPRRERRRIRAIVHNCQKHGVASQARGNPRFENWLLGYASYIYMVHPEEGEILLSQVRALIAPTDTV